MALFSKQNKEVFTNPLNVDNPILGQVLGICSALAVTSQLKPAIVMGLAVTVITAFSNTIISIIRNTIPNRIRIVVQLVVVAALVTIVSQILLRCERSALSICRTDYHQLYPDGPPRGFCHAEQALAFVPRWLRQRSGLRYDSGHRWCRSRVAGPWLTAGLPDYSRCLLRLRLCEQRYDDDASYGTDSRGMCDLGSSCLLL